MEVGVLDNAGITRRDAAWLVTRAATAVGGVSFLSDWLEAAHPGHSSAPPEPDRWSAYRPAFFSPTDFRSLDAYTAILIPTDSTPGAREAHVAPFIDFVVNASSEYAPEVQAEWRHAMAWLAAHNFAGVSAEEQLALVRAMAAPERDPSQPHDGFPVYRLIKEMTVRAFYTSRAGLVDTLEYKGNAYLTAFPSCGHPEHRQS